MSRMELIKRNASTRGYVATASVVATTALLVYGWWFLGLMSLGASGFLIYRWFAYRAKWGLRF